MPPQRDAPTLTVCTGKPLSRAIWQSFNKAAGPAARSDNVLAGKCNYPPVCTPLLMGARQRSGEGVVRRNGCPKTPFWTTISLHDPFAAPLVHPDLNLPDTLVACFLVVFLGDGLGLGEVAKGATSCDLTLPFVVVCTYSKIKAEAGRKGPTTYHS